jgi:predicted transcriptional regulator
MRRGAMESYVFNGDGSFLSLHKVGFRGFPLGKKYRSHFEIIALIIEAVKDGGQGKFSIVKRASINCGQFDKFLSSLLDMGFVEEERREGRPSYRASERGLAFLRQYYVLLSMFLVAENRSKRPVVIEPLIRRRPDFRY